MCAGNGWRVVIRRRETHGQEEEGWEYVLSLCLSACAWSGTGNEGQGQRETERGIRNGGIMFHY